MARYDDIKKAAYLLDDIQQKEELLTDAEAKQLVEWSDRLHDLYDKVEERRRKEEEAEYD